MPEAGLHASSQSRPLLRGMRGWRLAGVAFIGVCGLLIAGLIVLVALAPPPRPGTSSSIAWKKMNDGTFIVLEAVTIGRQHRFKYRWSEPAQPFDWLFAKPVVEYEETEETPGEEQVLWFTRRDAATGQQLDFDWWDKCVAIDDRGQEIEDVDYESGFMARSAKGSTGCIGFRPFPALAADEYRTIVAHSALPRFRCEASTFKLRVLGEGESVVAELDVPTAVLAKPSALPEWAPQPLPATQTDRDLSVTLSEVRARPWWSKPRDGLSRLHTNLEPKFEIRKNGELVDDWPYVEVSVCDALGNVDSPSTCRLNPYEPAWKLMVRLYHLAEYDDAETLRIQSDGLPESNSIQYLGDSLIVGPVTLELVAIGDGKVTYTESAPVGSNGRSLTEGTIGVTRERFRIEREDKDGIRTLTVDSPFPHLCYRLTGLDRNHRFQLQTFGYQNSEVFGQTRSFDDTNILLLPDMTLELSCKVIANIREMHEFEFLVKPPGEFRRPRKYGDRKTE